MILTPWTSRFVLMEREHTKNMRTVFWPLFRLSWFSTFFFNGNSPVYAFQARGQPPPPAHC